LFLPSFEKLISKNIFSRFYFLLSLFATLFEAIARKTQIEPKSLKICIEKELPSFDSIILTKFKLNFFKNGS